MLKTICQDASLPAACALSIWQGFPLPVGGPHNAQARGGAQGDARTKGKHCRAAGKESTLCAIPKGQLGQAIAYGSAGQHYPSPTPLGAMCTPTGGSLRSRRPGCSLWQRKAGTSRAPLAAGGRESLHLQHNASAGIFIPTRGARGTFLQSPTAP